MTAPAVPAARPAFRLTPTVVALVALAALAWVGVLAYARDMGNGAGSMGMPPSGVHADVGRDDGGDDAARRRAGRFAVRAHHQVGA